MTKNHYVKARVESVTPLTDSILQLIIEPSRYIEYNAGQYLQILFGDNAYSYSIANAPLGAHKYELHIRHSRDNPYNQELLAEIKKRGSLNIRVPLGACDVNHLHPDKPIIFIAGGTGFAPIKAMIEQLLAEGRALPFELFWSARQASDLYMDASALQWQAHVKHFRYFSLLSENSNLSLAAMISAEHPDDLQQWQIVINGPFDMVYNLRDYLVTSCAVSETDLFSDAFAFEKKE